jgi:hypothetical protein
MAARTGAMVATALLAVVLTGCAGGAMGGGSDSTAGTPPMVTTPGTLAPTPSGTPAPVPPARWDAITADLANRGVTATPTLVLSQDVTWPNGALGCPQPGQSYTQAIVEGMQVVVTADGKTYDYRFGTGDTPSLCPS